MSNTIMPTDFAIRIEQMRQARRIHGGTLPMCAAAAAVRLSRVNIPSRWLRERVYRRIYGTKYSGLSEEELERPLGDYRSLNELFTRGVRAGSRPVAHAENQFLSPCDGTVQDCGRLDRDSLLTVKGIEYSLSSLLPEVETSHYINGTFAILFLSPADCHRVFTPQRAVLREIIHVPGSRLLVHPPFQRREFPVFALNERIILLLETPLGRCVLVMVAGWGVGNITFPFGVRLSMSRRRVTRQRLAEPREFDAGEWLATFELGSTVVMLTEPRPETELRVKRGGEIQYGQPVIEVDPPAERDRHLLRTDHSGLQTSTVMVVDPDGRLGRSPPRQMVLSNRRVVFANNSHEPVALVGRSAVEAPAIDRLIIMLPSQPRASGTRVLERCMALAAQHPSCRVCVVSDYRVHLGDENLRAIERLWQQRLMEVAADRIHVIRTGEIAESIRERRQVLQALSPLVSDSFRTCTVDRTELFGVLDSVAMRPSSRRIVTLLGENQPLREVLEQQLTPSWKTRPLTAAAQFLRLASVDRLVGVVVRLADQIRRTPRVQLTDTLEPTSAGELLELYNPWNRSHVAIAGYNNGVTHFGWRYPDRTVLKTTRAGRRIRVRDTTVDVDAGVTLKDLDSTLRRAGRALLVMPNYSYVSTGTAFFVSVHGSGRAVATLGQTIEQALLYDPRVDRLRLVRRGDGDFERYMYDRTSGALLLRLTLRTCERTSYRRSREELRAPTAAEIWNLFADESATNVEVRKASASAETVEVFRYRAVPDKDEASLAAPRDRIGSLWDRLEERRFMSAAFHGLVRRFGYHVELILSESQFEIFWEQHRRLPIAKLQLRFMPRDGLPHSPCGDCDCMAIDLFMWRRNSDVFLDFIKQHLPHARFNSGKHSL